MKKIIQNKPTPIQEPEARELSQGEKICREAAITVFDNVMRWFPLRDASEFAANLLITEMDNADFFTEHYKLTEKQKEFIKSRIAELMRKGADMAVEKITDFDNKKEKKIGDVVIRELVKIPEQTMAAIGASNNRGPMLAMTAVAGDTTNDNHDKIIMRKTKLSGDITLGTNGAFISTNCIIYLKESMNFQGIDIDLEVK